MTSDTLQQAIDRVCSKDSFYWAFREGSAHDHAVEQEVEVRIDLPVELVNDSFSWDGWSVHKVDHYLEAVFLRRKQALRDDDVRRLFMDALTIADQVDGRFHSWMHGDDLDPSPEKGS